MKYEVIPFSPEHAEEIIKRNLIESKEIPVESKKWALDAFVGGPSYSLVVDGQLVACGGVRKIWEGYGEAWSLITQEALSCLKTLFRESGKYLETIIRDNNFIRVEANVRADRGDFCNWACHLGFKVIAKRKKYGPDGSDYFLYERVQ